MNIISDILKKYRRLKKLHWKNYFEKNQKSFKFNEIIGSKRYNNYVYEKSMDSNAKIIPNSSIKINLYINSF